MIITCFCSSVNSLAHSEDLPGFAAGCLRGEAAWSVRRANRIRLLVPADLWVRDLMLEFSRQITPGEKQEPFHFLTRKLPWLTFRRLYGKIRKTVF